MLNSRNFILRGMLSLEITIFLFLSETLLSEAENLLPYECWFSVSYSLLRKTFEICLNCYYWFFFLVDVSSSTLNSLLWYAMLFRNLPVDTNVIPFDQDKILSLNVRIMIVLCTLHKLYPKITCESFHLRMAGSLFWLTLIGFL